MPVGRSAKRRISRPPEFCHGQRRDGFSSDRVAAAALLLSVGNMVPWALCYIRFLRFAFFCRRRDPRLKSGEKGQNGCLRGGLCSGAGNVGMVEMLGWSKGDRAESIGSQSRYDGGQSNESCIWFSCAAYGMKISKNSDA